MPPKTFAAGALVVAIAIAGVRAVQARVPSSSATALGVTEGAGPDGTTVFDGGVAGVARLDPALLAALRDAANDADGEGIEFVVDSGWRSPAYQQALLDDAIAEHGSRAAAIRWVATPTTSVHVTGDAVDLA